MTVYSYLHGHVSVHREGANLKRNAYNKISTGNSLIVCICLTTTYVTDRSH